MDKPLRDVEDVEVGAAGKISSDLRECLFRQAVRINFGQATLSKLLYL